jgi:hypothetical protein
VSRITGGVLLTALAVFAAPAAGEDDFPIVGTYWRDAVCKGDGSGRPDLQVRITRQQIDSDMGACRILNRKRAGKAYLIHVECKIAGGALVLGDVTFTMRDGTTLDFEDQDHTSDATLYRCPASTAAQ